jgi:hypothetical protein
VVLRLRAVAGLVQIKLNGTSVNYSKSEHGDVEVDLRPLATRRVRLSLYVDPSDWPVFRGAQETWGEVALVIHSD